MTIKKFISGALAVTTFAWLFGASLFAPMASAQTTDLQAQIAALLAQIATLQAQLNSGSGTPSSFVFTKNLTLGSSNSEVKQLQIYLNAAGFKVSTSGVGSPGYETMYFGTKTQAALAKFQAANGISPAIGYFGPITRAKINGGVVVVPPGGTVPPGTSAVVISTNNPAAGTVVIGQSQADLAHFTFNGNYTVTGLTFKRIGISADTSLSNVFLFDGDTRLTDAASVSAGSLITFNNGSGLFTVNGSRTISVKADLAGSAGETLGVQLVSYTLSGGSPVTVNLSGNLFNVATASLATAALATPTSAGNSDPGNDILVWQGTMTVGVRDIVLKRVALRNIGSINSSDIRNFRLFVDGTQVSSQSSLDSNGYVTFANVGKAVQTGARTVKVLADITGGSGRTVQMSLRGAYDITVTDTQYNVNPTVTGSFPFSGNSITVNNGTISVVRASDSPSNNVTLNASDVSLAKYTMTAYGESVKVETLKFYVNVTGSDTTSTLRNGRVLINGVQYGSTALINASSSPTSYTVNYTVQPGSPATVEVRGDIYNSGTAYVAGNTVKVTMKAGSANGTPSVSLTPVNVPTGDVDGIALTVSTGGLTMTKDATYADRNVVVPVTAYKLADFTLSNSNVEDVTVNTITLTYATTTSALSNLNDLYVKFGSNQTSVKATPSISGDSFSVNYLVAKNTSQVIEVYASIGSGAVANGTYIVSVALTGTTASGQAANVSPAKTGQTLTVKTGGTISAMADGNNPVAQIVAANTTQVVNATKISAVDDSFNITDVTATTTNVTTVQALQLWDGASMLAQGSPDTNGSVTFSGLVGITATVSNPKVLTVKAVLGGVGSGAGTSGSAITTAITAVTAKSASNGTAVALTGLPVAGGATYVYKAIPTVNRVALPSTALAAGTQTVARFNIGSSDGVSSIAWRKLVLAVTTSTASTTFATATVWGPGGQIAGTATTTGGVVAFTADADQVVSTAVEYSVKMTLGGTMTAGDSISFSLARPSAHINSTTLSTAQNGSTATLVWSDLSGAPHSDSSSDWSNDNLVKNLPADTWTLSK